MSLAAFGPVGLLGLGAMGEPMAKNLLNAGARLTVWNRTPEKAHTLAEAGAEVGTSPHDVFTACRIVVAMLLDEEALDAVLGRKEPGFAARMEGRTLVNMATVMPAYSEELEADIRAAGGRYVEAPVMGTRAPAEQGRLVGLVSGAETHVDEIMDLLAPMCTRVIRCGPIGTALRLKLATNLLLIDCVTGLAEAVHFAERSGVDLALFADALDGSPMDSPVLKLKMGKLLARDYSRQGAVEVVLRNSDLVRRSAEELGVATPLLELCGSLYGQAVALGLGEKDMIAVVAAFAHRAGGADASNP